VAADIIATHSRACLDAELLKDMDKCCVFTVERSNAEALADLAVGTAPAQGGNSTTLHLTRGKAVARRLVG